MRFNVVFTAQMLTKDLKKTVRIEREFKGVRARDTYHAQDIIAKRLGRNYALTFNRVFCFGQPKLRLSKAAAAAVAGAGPEEN